jgi:phospholipid/cholesterol/gamma-HCH transport system substrate-binding protein
MSDRPPRFGVELSVGVFVLAAAFFLAIMVFMTGGFVMHGDTFSLKVGYNDISGLKPRAPVLVAGTQLGSVSDIVYHEPRTIDGADTYCVTVTVRLPASVRIPEGTVAFISSAGFIGEIFVGLDPGRSPRLLEDGALIRGKEMVSFAQVQETADDTLRTINDVVGDFRGVSGFFGETGVQRDMRAVITNARQVSEELKLLVAQNRELVNRSLERVDRITASAETNVTTATENLRVFTADLRQTSTEVRTTIRSLSERLEYISQAGGETMMQTLENARVATATARDGVERLSTDLTAASATINRVTTGSETDAIQIVRNLRATSDELRSTATILKGIATSVDSGTGMAGAILKDRQVEGDFRAILEHTARAAEKLELLIEEIKKNPGSFFKFSLL